MSREIIKGSLLRLYLTLSDGTRKAIASSRSCTMTRTSDTKEVGWRKSGAWKKLKVTRKSWSIDAESLIPSDGAGVVDLENLFDNGSEVAVDFGTLDGSESAGRMITYTGKALVTRLTYGAANRKAATIGITLTGTGAVKSTSIGCGTLWDDTALLDDTALWVE